MLSVPGVLVRAELDRPHSWRGRWHGDEVDVVVVPVAPEPAIREAAVAALQPLVGVAPGCRAALLCHDGVAVVSAPVGGRPLASLPPLTRGRAVAVGVAVAGALAVLHARGLVWGGAYDEVLVSDRGEVGLPLHGLVARRLAGERRTPRDDVHALAAMLHERCPALEVTADDAEALRRALRRAARPQPLALAGAVARPVRTRPRAQPRLVLAGAGVVAAAAVALVGWSSAGGRAPRADIAPAPLAPSPTHAAAPVDWRAVVAGLDRARAAGLAGSADLAGADAAGSPVLAADAATQARLRAAAPGTAPPLPVLQQVSVVRADPATAVLRVTDALPAYAYRDAAGRTLATAPARPTRTWTVTLTAVGGGWRFASVS